MSRREDWVDALYEFAVAHPAGFHNVDFMARYGCDLPTFNVAARGLRRQLAGDSINLVCQPAGWGPWVYQLVGDLDESRPWVRNRIGDARTRVRTMSAVADSLVNATDGRTTDGRLARVMRRSFTRLVEDLDEIDTGA
jgi:hypothetical protein